MRFWNFRHPSRRLSTEGAQVSWGVFLPSANFPLESAGCPSFFPFIAVRNCLSIRSLPRNFPPESQNFRARLSSPAS